MAKKPKCLHGANTIELEAHDYGPSIYFLFYEGELVYVGQSHTPKLRIADHIRQGFKVFDQVFVLPVPSEGHDLGEIEGAFIRAARPYYNVRVAHMGDNDLEVIRSVAPRIQGKTWRRGLEHYKACGARWKQYRRRENKQKERGLTPIESAVVDVLNKHSGMYDRGNVTKYTLAEWIAKAVNQVLKQDDSGGLHRRPEV